MKIYVTDSGLGYQQKAYLIRLGVSEHGHDYLCIGGLFGSNQDMYTTGKVVEDMEDIYITETKTLKLRNSDLGKDFLFMKFIELYYPEDSDEKMLTGRYDITKREIIAGNRIQLCYGGHIHTVRWCNEDMDFIVQNETTDEIKYLDDFDKQDLFIRNH